jgi:hypothetical protein
MSDERVLVIPCNFHGKDTYTKLYQWNRTRCDGCGYIGDVIQINIPRPMKDQFLCQECIKKIYKFAKEM